MDKYPYSEDPPETIGWSTSAKDLGFVSPDAFSSPDIICHEDAKPGATSAKVAAGDTIELQWTEWPESHHGPVIDYLANCNGDCSSVDKTALRFFKIDEAGILDGADQSGTWATDKLISNNNSWAVTVPESIAPGNYVLRHEIIALHSAGDQGGAQNYPQCLNLEVTGGRSEKPKGTPGMELYTPKDDGILFNIYQQIDEYPIPGPPVFSGGSGSSPQPPASSTSPSPSAPSTTTQPPRESSKPTTSPANGGSQSSSSSPAQDPKPTSSAPQQTPGPTPSGATPQLPVDLPEDLTPQELLFVAREIVDRLLSKHVQLEVEQK